MVLCGSFTKTMHINFYQNQSNIRSYDKMASIYKPCLDIHCVQKKNTHSHIHSYLHELFVDLNKNGGEYTQGLTHSDNVQIRYSFRSMT